MESTRVRSRLRRAREGVGDYLSLLFIQCLWSCMWYKDIFIRKGVMGIFEQEVARLPRSRIGGCAKSSEEGYIHTDK